MLLQDLHLAVYRERVMIVDTLRIKTIDPHWFEPKQWCYVNFVIMMWVSYQIFPAQPSRAAAVGLHLEIQSLSGLNNKAVWWNNIDFWTLAKCDSDQNMFYPTLSRYFFFCLPGENAGVFLPCAFGKLKGCQFILQFRLFASFAIDLFGSVKFLWHARTYMHIHTHTVCSSSSIVVCAL